MGQQIDVQNLMSGVQNTLAVGRVFGEPIERDGVTVIPVAIVGGASGGGGGGNDDENGSGAGFGVRARPAGVYVIRSGHVEWQPALDLNRVIIGGQAVAVIGLLTLRGYLKRRAKRS
jgi:uncharacterized spore protein YtfJ